MTTDWSRVRVYLTRLRLEYFGNKVAPFARLVEINRNTVSRYEKHPGETAQIEPDAIDRWLALTSGESLGQFFSRVERGESWVKRDASLVPQIKRIGTSPVMPSGDTLPDKSQPSSGESFDAAAAQGFGVSTEKLVAKVLFHLGYVLVGASKDPRIIEAIRLRDATQTEGRGGDADPLRTDFPHFPRVDEK